FIGAQAEVDVGPPLGGTQAERGLVAQLAKGEMAHLERGRGRAGCLTGGWTGRLPRGKQWRRDAGDGQERWLQQGDGQRSFHANSVFWGERGSRLPTWSRKTRTLRITGSPRGRVCSAMRR